MWVKFEPDGGKLLKVTWSGNAGIFVGAYFIGPETLSAAADDVRTELTALSQWAASGQDAQTRWERLTALAEAGKQLHSALFLDANHWREILEIKELIAAEPTELPFSVQAESELYVPWGLVYDGEVPEHPGEVEPDKLKEVEMALFSGFWALKYNLSVGSKHHPPSRNNRSRKNFGLLSLVHDQIYGDVRQKATTDPACRRLCEQMSSMPVKTVDSLKECQELIEQTDATDILFHFFGHQHAQKLHLGSKGAVSLIQFAELINSLSVHGQERNATPYGLMFLNGCESALGNADFGFRSRAMSDNMCGVIATEAIVQTSFAVDFGGRFLEAIKDRGKTVSEAMHDLWHEKDLWPESLLYGCYANPQYRIRSDAPAAVQ